MILKLGGVHCSLGSRAWDQKRGRNSLMVTIKSTEVFKVIIDNLIYSKLLQGHLEYTEKQEGAKTVPMGNHFGKQLFVCNSASLEVLKWHQNSTPRGDELHNYEKGTPYFWVFFH